MEQFGLRTRIIMGDGLDSLTAGMKKAFVVTDSFMAQSGKVSYVTDKLNRAGVEWQVFSDIAGEPDIGMVTAGTEKITEFKPDTVICLGGGAAIDAAKAIVFIARKTGAVEITLGLSRFRRRAVPVQRLAVSRLLQTRRTESSIRS